MQTFFVDHIGDTPEVLITGDEYFHATRSCRVRPGETVAVFDGKGKRFEARIRNIDAESFTAELVTDVSGGGEPPSVITVALALIRPARFEWALEKCTELGVRQFVPLVTEHCTHRPERFKQDRLARIALEAAKQSGRSYIPAVTEPVVLKDGPERFWSAAGDNPVVLAASFSGERGLPEILADEADGRTVMHCIGPEGGFTDGEIALLEEHGALLYTLGRSTLRSETAAVAATAMTAIR